MTSFLKYKGYFGTIEYCEEDNLFYGKVAGIRSLISYEGTTLNELKTCFEESLDYYLESCEAHGDTPNKTSLEEIRKTMNEKFEELVQNYAAV